MVRLVFLRNVRVRKTRALGFCTVSKLRSICGTMMWRWFVVVFGRGGQTNFAVIIGYYPVIIICLHVFFHICLRLFILSIFSIFMQLPTIIYTIFKYPITNKTYFCNRSPEFHPLWVPRTVQTAYKKFEFFSGGGFAPRTPIPSRPHSRPPKLSIHWLGGWT